MKFINSDPLTNNKAKDLLSLFLTSLQDEQKKYEVRGRPEIARFKLKIYWLDPKIKPLVKYSEDFSWQRNKKIHSEAAAFFELKEIMRSESKADKISSAMLWVNLDKIPKVSNDKYNFVLIKAVRGKLTEFNIQFEFENEFFRFKK